MNLRYSLKDIGLTKLITWKSVIGVGNLSTINKLKNIGKPKNQIQMLNRLAFG
jgi:hypothetical protein